MITGTTVRNKKGESRWTLTESRNGQTIGVSGQWFSKEAHSMTMLRKILAIDSVALVHDNVTQAMIALREGRGNDVLLLMRDALKTLDNIQRRVKIDEYTPAQRKVIDRQLAKAKADVKAGRTHGPFNTADEMIDFLHSGKSRKTAKKK